MSLDQRTMFVVLIASTLLTGGGLLTVTRGHAGDIARFRRCGLGTLLQAAGWFVTAWFREGTPGLTSHVVGPAFIVAGLIACVSSASASEENRSARGFFTAAFATGGGVVTTCVALFLMAAPSTSRVGGPEVLPSWLLLALYLLTVALPFGFLLVFTKRSIASQARAEETLSDAAHLDALTQLPGRATICAWLERLSTPPPSPGRHQCAVLFIDINNFKYVNDSLGHSAGDQLLRETGQRLGKEVAARDAATCDGASLVGRFGGDEFVLLMDRVAAPEDAVAMAERVLQEMAVPFVLEGQRVTVQCSIGISVGDAGTVAADDLLREADTAMYRAKAAGRANFALFDESMRVEARRRLTMESDLREALATGQICAHYQPIVDLSTGSIVAFEALARWRHPEKGMIRPDLFIPIAEETGLIVQVGQLIMDQAAATLERMNRLPDGASVCMNVNVSRRELVHPHFFARLEGIVGSLSVAPGRLRLEITETVVSGVAAEPVAELLRALKGLGVEIHLDDFGTGLSSLSVLRSLPLDGIKIDRSFIAGSNGDVEAITILNAIISLGRNLGKTITVEGIEARAEVATALALDTNLAQGYLFGRPMPASEAEALLGTDFSALYVAA